MPKRRERRQSLILWITGPQGRLSRDTADMYPGMLFFGNGTVNNKSCCCGAVGGEGLAFALEGLFFVLSRCRGVFFIIVPHQNCGADCLLAVYQVQGSTIDHIFLFPSAPPPPANRTWPRARSLLVLGTGN